MNNGSSCCLSFAGLLRAYRRLPLGLPRAVLRDLADALSSHRLGLRAIADYCRETVKPVLRPDTDSVARKLAADCAEPPEDKKKNPLTGAREAAACLISYPRLRDLQARIIKPTFLSWYGLKVKPRQAAVLGCFSDTAWIARGLMKTAGLPDSLAVLSAEDRRRLAIVLEPYVRSMDLRRAHLEGLSRPGRTVLAALSQKRRIGRLRRRNFAPEDLEILYPDMLDRETLRYRQENITTLRDEALRLVEARRTSRQFENYMHLQTLVISASSRGPKQLGRFMAAVELRHTA